jgi:hypothetical protein
MNANYTMITLTPEMLKTQKCDRTHSLKMAALTLFRFKNQTKVSHRLGNEAWQNHITSRSSILAENHSMILLK